MLSPILSDTEETHGGRPCLKMDFLTAILLMGATKSWVFQIDRNLRTKTLGRLIFRLVLCKYKTIGLKK